jgi:HK97 family phage major capsid protein
MRGMSEAERQLRDELVDVREREDAAIKAKAPESEIRALVRREGEIKDALVTITGQSRDPQYDGMRGMGASSRGAADVPEIRGEPDEQLVPGQSFREWVARASENGVSRNRSDGRPVRVESREKDYLEDYWAVKLGLRAETRALNEDTSGSGLAITPESWVGSVIDYLYPMTVLGRAGITRSHMATEVVNVPQFAEPVAPAWIAESSPIGIDANPAFSGPIQLNATGGFKDITTYSIEMAQDAYINGGLSDFLAQSAARKYAIAVDNAGLQGVVGNAGNPGLVNETNFVQQGVSGDSGSGYTVADTTLLSKLAQKLANLNVDPHDARMQFAYISNPSVKGTFARVNASTYAKFWDAPSDVADLVENRWFTSANPAILPTTETDGTDGAGGALTGGALSSIYTGPWSFGMFGVHLDMITSTLRERFLDLGQVGLFCFMRFSIRWGHPETFCRTGGIITTS